MSRFVRQEEIHLEVGPQQLALAVSEGDMGQLTLAMRAASSMWGGRQFPILAVTESGRVAAGGGGLPLLDTMDATTVIDFSGRLVAAGEVRSEDGVRVPVVPAQPLEDAEQWSPPPLVGFALDELKGMRMFEAATEDPAAVAA